MTQDEVVRLAGGFIYQGQILRGIVEETHISWVILTARYAFKLKKPLRLSFLDFSDLSARRAACEKELRLNRRFSDIYLDVAPLRATSAGWMFGGEGGRVVDYAVVMKRMQSSKRMDVLLAAGRVNQQQMFRLATRVARFHAEAELVDRPFDAHAMREAFNDIGGIGEVTRSHTGPDGKAIVERAIQWSDAFIGRHEPRFALRASLGFRRDVHGDLHAANIFMYAEPVIFDCIEFNDTFRQIDILDEVAFLCMDVESYGESRLADAFRDRYLSLSGAMQSAEDEAIFLYYKCYRANVRAKVHALAAAQAGEATTRGQHLDRFRRYLSLIQRYIA